MTLGNGEIARVRSMPTDQLRPQRRRRSVAMTSGEIDDFLGSERTCRIATVNEGDPHLSALWFVWDGEFLWLYSIIRSKRWKDVTADSRVSVLVDTGHEYSELRGVEIIGNAEPVGEVPSSGEPSAELERPEREFARKYFDSDQMPHDQRHAWLRIRPEKMTSWDFRKMELG